jgi:hypothetical protein
MTNVEGRRPEGAPERSRKLPIGTPVIDDEDDDNLTPRQGM